MPHNKYLLILDYLLQLLNIYFFSNYDLKISSNTLKSINISVSWAFIFKK